MGRRPREDFQGAWHHAMNRVRGGELLFDDDPGRVLFLETLGDSADRFGIEVHAYALMPTHYHVLLRSPLGNVSRAMQYLGSNFTRRRNAMRRRDGPVFRGRFASQPISSERHLLAVFAYIHLNPLRDGLITRIDSDEAWTSHRAYLGVERGPQWLKRDHFIERFDGPKELGALVLAYHRGSRPWPEGFELHAGWFTTSVERPDAEGGLSDDVPDEVPLSELVEALCETTGVDRDELTRSRRGRVGNPARRFAVWALARTTSLSQREIGDVLGMTAPHVAQDMRRPRPKSEHFDEWVASWKARFPDRVAVIRSDDRASR